VRTATLPASRKMMSLDGDAARIGGGRRSCQPARDDKTEEILARRCVVVRIERFEEPNLIETCRREPPTVLSPREMSAINHFLGGVAASRKKW